MDCCRRGSFSATKELWHALQAAESADDKGRQVAPPTALPSVPKAQCTCFRPDPIQLTLRAPVVGGPSTFDWSSLLQ
jgi:hypothetical protein